MFNNVGSIYVSTIDADGNPHGFDDVVTESYIEIFNDTDADFGLYVVKGIDDKSNMNPGYWIFTVDFIKSNRLPSKANGLARFKFFEGPTGGEAGQFVKKTGDEMSGALTLENTQDNYSVTSTDAAARFVFENKKSNGATKTVQLYQPGDDNSLVIDSTLRLENDLRVKGKIVNWKDNDQNVTTRNAFVDLNYHPEKGILGFTESGTDQSVLEWNLYSGVECAYVPSVSGYGFRVRGKIGDHYSDTTTTNNNTHLLYTYHHSGETDEIKYFGRITDPKNLSTKEYVDDEIAALLARIEELENNSSTGGGSGSMSRNIRLTVQSSSSSANSITTNQIQTFNAKADKLYVNIPGVAFKPQGRINITEVGRGDTGPIYSFHITSVRNSYVNSSNQQILELGVVLEGPANNGGGYSMSSGKNLYLSLVDGAWDEETPVSSSIKISISSSNMWATDTTPVPNSGKLYRLDQNGNLTTDVYPYGAFIPGDYIETTSNIKYYGVSDDTSGSWYYSATNNVVDATINGVKGVKVWGTQSRYYNHSNEVEVFAFLGSYAPSD